MHVDWCPSASAVSGTPVEPGEEMVHKSKWIFCYSGSYSEQHPTRMSDHCTHNLLVLRSPQFSFKLGPQSSWGTNLWWQYACFSTASKGLATSPQSKHWSAIARSARPAPPDLSERNECVKETVLLKVQRSTFKSLWKKWGASSVVLERMQVLAKFESKVWQNYSLTTKNNKKFLHANDQLHDITCFQVYNAL